jgi:hypothetical protein
MRWRISWIQERSVSNGRGGWSRAQGELKRDAKRETEQVKGQIMGKIEEMWMSLPWRWAASVAEKEECGTSQVRMRSKIPVSLASGRATERFWRFQSKPI